MTKDSDPEGWLFETLLRWEDLRDRGQDPDPRALCADRPELLDELLRLIRELAAIEGLSPDRSWRGSPSQDGASRSDDGRPVAPSEPLVATTRYGRVALLARGGLGEVFVASDEGLNRQVALKEILGRRAHDTRDQALFLAEARVTGNLEHPGIVPVHGLGASPDGRPFYIMKRVRGGTLGDAIRRFHAPGSPGPRPGEQRLELRRLLARFTAVCNAVAFAHSRMVLHCDLKPNNIILGDYGETLVVDWGLAVPATRPAPGGDAPTDPLSWPFAGIQGLQREGAGTGAYMSPEQAAGRLDSLGPESDVFSLGATLYHVLFGSAPARVGGDPSGRRAEAPPPPEGGRPDVPRALTAVCRKAMSPRPDNRYASASLLVDDIQHWLDDEPVSAYRDPLPVRVARSVRHNRTKVAATTALLATALVSMAVGSVLIAQANVRAARNLFGQRRMANLVTEIDRGTDGGEWSAERLERLDRNVRELGNLDADLAGMKRQHVNTRFANHLLIRLAQPHLRPAEVDHVVGLIALMEPRDRDQASSIRRAAGNRIGRWQPVADYTPAGGGADAVFDPAILRAGPGPLAPKPSAGEGADTLVPTRVESGGSVRVEATFAASWEAAPSVGLALNANLGHVRPIRALAVSADGKYLVTSGDDLAIKVWDPSTGRVLHSITGHAQPSDAVALSPDGRTLAAVDPSRGIAIHDTATGTRRRYIAQAGQWLAAVAFSADGRSLFVGTSDGSVEVRDPATGRLLSSMRDRPGQVQCLTLSPDGKLLAAGNAAGEVTLWDVATGRPRATMPGPSPAGRAQCVAFSPDGSLLAVGFFAEAEVAIREVATGRLRQTLPKETWVRSIAFVSDGKTLAAVHYQRVHLWDVSTGQRRDEKSFTLDGLGAGAMAPREGRLYVGSNDGSVHRWDADSTRALPPLRSRGYLFRVRVVPRPGTPAGGAEGPPATMAGARQGRGDLQLEILRDGTLLRRKSVTAKELPPGPLRVRAERDGDLLTLQAGASPPLEFRDEFPLGGNDPGLVALEWHASVGLERFHAGRRTLPADANPLEVGDEEFDKGDFHRALLEYQKRALVSITPEAVQQARYKEALCLASLGREPEAIHGFETLAGEEGDVWPPLAACRLWLSHLRRGNHPEAGRVFDSLSHRYPYDHLVRLIPDDQRSRILDSYVFRAKSLNLYKHDPTRIPNTLDALRIAEYFVESPTLLEALRTSLTRAYRMEGHDDKALVHARKALGAAEEDPAFSRNYPYHLAFEYSWVLRALGRSEEARTELDRRLFDASGGLRAGRELLLLERARVLAAQGLWDEAEDDIEALFRALEPDAMHFEFPAACLVRGFLRERRGDEAGALAAWRQGVLPEERADPHHGFQWANSMILAGLTGAVDERRFASYMASISGFIGREDSRLKLITMVPFPASVIGEAWQTPGGREAARTFAFQAEPFPAHIRIPPLTIVTEYVRRHAFPGGTSPTQEVILRQAVERFLASFYEGGLSVYQFAQLRMAWKGTTNALGWGGVASKLDPGLRGPLAYVLGHRALRLGLNEDAKRLFQAALAEAPDGSDLRREARAGVDLANGSLTLPSDPFAPGQPDDTVPD